MHRKQCLFKTMIMLVHDESATIYGHFPDVRSGEHAHELMTILYDCRGAQKVELDQILRLINS